MVSARIAGVLGRVSKAAHLTQPVVLGLSGRPVRAGPFSAAHVFAEEENLCRDVAVSLISKCEFFFLSTGNCGDINLVRLGPEKSINNEVLKFSLDSQVNHRMSEY